jgi:hypothetical protein
MKTHKPWKWWEIVIAAVGLIGGLLLLGSVLRFIGRM